jgi:capsular exopolysaccharide synthesis family protein
LAIKDHGNPIVRAIQGETGQPASYRRTETRGAVSGLESLLGRTQPDEHLVSLLSPATIEAEQYRTLSLMLEQRRQSGLLQVIAISSPMMGDGKTVTAINLAGAVGQSPQARVLLIDLDLRKPSVAAQLGLRDSGLGFRDAFVNRGMSLKEVVRRHPAWNVSVVTAGRAQVMPHEVFKAPRFGELLDEARSDYEWIILDTAPLVLAPDCLMMARTVDGFVMVICAHKTARTEVAEALNVLGASKLVGLVFNSDDRLLKSYAYGPYCMPSQST